MAHRHAPRHERKAERQCIGLMSRSTVILHTGLGADVSRERSPRDISMPRSSTIVDYSAPSCRSHDSSRCLVLLCCVASTEKVVADERLTSPFGYHRRHTMRIRQRTITSWRPTTNRQHHESATERQAGSESVVQQHHVEQRPASAASARKSVVLDASLGDLRRETVN